MDHSVRLCWQVAVDDWDSSDAEADDEAEEGGMNCPTSPTLPSSPPPTTPVRQVCCVLSFRATRWCWGRQNENRLICFLFLAYGK